MPDEQAAISLTCPDCRQPIGWEPLCCSSCGWCGEHRDGVPVVLSTTDRADATFSSYLSNYDRISRDDLAQPILDLNYVRYQAGNLISLIGAPRGQRVLDLGCGRGVLGKALAERGAATVVGVDLSIAYLSTLASEQGIRPVCANAENLPFHEQFDLAISTDVLEHVLNVGSFLYSLNRALRPGGRVCIRVPHNENLLNYSPQLGCPYRFVHLRSFNKRLLNDVLAGAGFQVDRFRFDGFVPGNRRSCWLSPASRGNRIEDYILRRVGDPASITSWPPAIAGLLWRPHEVIVMATKVKRIVPSRSHGHELVDAGPR